MAMKKINVIYLLFYMFINIMCSINIYSLTVIFSINLKYFKTPHCFSYRQLMCGNDYVIDSFLEKIL